MLRFIRSLWNSRGECRGEFRGELQGDIPGDPQGEREDWGFSWLAWGLLSGKEPASPELSLGASLIMQIEGSTKLLWWCVLQLSSQSSQVIRVVHLKAATFSHRKAWNNSWVWYTSYSQTLVGVRNLQLSQQSYLQASSMETDRSAAVSPLLCVNLCLHSIEPWLNMARLEL